jgi:glutaminyl-tRNA synthetase
MNTEATPAPSNFIKNIISEDVKNNKHDGKVTTRFPPEPNGYLHIGHAKSICLNFGVVQEYKEGKCNLRFDDTNPSKEEAEYMEAIKLDVHWLGFDWGDQTYHASDYFDQLYEYAVELIKKDKAYVCSLSPEYTREYRGTLQEPGKDSPFRSRSIGENLDLFKGMKNGEFQEGDHVLRAKIDMTAPNMNMRDPAIYRIKNVKHNRTGDKWSIYPMYDFAHCLSDSIEGITHSLCTLEFEDHRPLYDWMLDQLDVQCHPQQIEFARLNLSYTIMSKRKLQVLVEKKYVDGWDDPRMPTIAGLRRRGYTAESIRNFCDRIGVAKRDSMVDVALLEFSIREDLNEKAPRHLGVLRPLKVVIDNYPKNQSEDLDAPFHPNQPDMGSRPIPFSRVIYIEKDDFMEDPPKKFFRLSPGREVRLRYAYFIKCEYLVKDEKTGEIIEVHCSYDPETRGGNSPDGRKVKATLHWVSATHAINAEVRLYDRLFHKENPDEGTNRSNYTDSINQDSLEILTNCKIEPGLADVSPGYSFQFERLGYFCNDMVDSSKEKPVFNRTVTLRDSWAKIAKKGKRN